MSSRSCIRTSARETRARRVVAAKWVGYLPERVSIMVRHGCLYSPPGTVVGVCTVTMYRSLPSDAAWRDVAAEGTFRRRVRHTSCRRRVHLSECLVCSHIVWNWHVWERLREQESDGRVSRWETAAEGRRKT